jgi:hypothetical protein
MLWQYLIILAASILYTGALYVFVLRPTLNFPESGKNQ